MDVNQLDNVYARIPRLLTVCPLLQCNISSSEYSRNTNFPWAITLSCRCNNKVTKWNVCMLCDDKKRCIKMVTNRQLTNHYSNCHRKQYGAQFDISLLNIGVENSKTEEELILLSDRNHNYLNANENLAVHRISRLYTNNPDFYQFKMNGGHGHLLLSSCSIYQNTSYTNNIGARDAKLNFALAQILFHLSIENKKKLAIFFKLLFEKLDDEFSLKIKNKHGVPIDWLLPLCINDVRNKYVEGKHAYIKNVAIPLFKKVKEYYYCPIMNCLQFMLNNGIPLKYLEESDVENVKHLHESMSAQKIIKKAKLLHNNKLDRILLITVWSDSFEPNTSTKANRGSVYIKTISFFRPEDSPFPIQFYTNVICIGPSKGNTNQTEIEFEKELNLFNTEVAPTFFDPVTRSNVSIHIEILYCVQDQPERRSGHCMTMGNSTSAGRWGYALDYKQLRHTIVSCDLCQQKLESGINSASCSSCCNWNIGFNDEKLLYKPRRSYPNMAPGYEMKDGKIYPKQITHKMLIEIVKMTNDNIVNEKWTEENGKAFLLTYGISPVKVRQIIQAASRRCSYEYVVKYKLQNEYDVLMKLYKKCPQKFKLIEYTPVWKSTLDLKSYIDAIMHLYFLGIAKSLMKNSQDWLKKRGLLKTFLDEINDYMIPVADLKIKWCPIIPYGTGKFGGHVSENYLAMTRIMKWYFRLFLDYPEKLQFQEPQIQQSKWLKITNVEWLKIRGLNTVGNAIVVRDRVQSYMADPTKIPPIQEKRGGPVELLMSVIVLFHRLVSVSLHHTATEEHIHNVNISVKKFLNKYNELVTKLYKPKDGTPSWIKKYNFLSLLNIPDQLRNFGPLLNTWEGGVNGEAIISFIKPEIKTGLRRNWEKTTMIKIWRKRSFQLLDMELNPEKFSTSNSVYDIPEYKKMSGFAELHFSFVNKMPFVAERIGVNFYVLLSDKSLIPLEHIEYHKTVLDAAYHTFDIFDCKITKTISTHNSFLFLPGEVISFNDNCVRATYYVISSRWKEIDANNTLSFS